MLRERRASVSRTVTSKHGSIGKELRDVRKLIWELLRTSCSCSNVTYGRQSSRCGQPSSP